MQNRKRRRQCKYVPPPSVYSKSRRVGETAAGSAAFFCVFCRSVTLSFLSTLCLSAGNSCGPAAAVPSNQEIFHTPSFSSLHTQRPEVRALRSFMAFLHGIVRSAAVSVAYMHPPSKYVRAHCCLACHHSSPLAQDWISTTFPSPSTTGLSGPIRPPAIPTTALSSY